MNVCLRALGCRVNEAELQAWSRALREGGYRVVSEAGAADVVVVNSCAVTHEAGRRSRKAIYQLHRSNPRARVVVTGCYAELEPERVGAIDGVDLVIGNRDKDALVARLGEALGPPRMPALATEPEASLFAESRTRAFVKVQDGCRNRCTFCVVTVARGVERSRAVAEVIADVRAAHDAGQQEAVLTGIHLGGYGADLGTTLRDLVETVLAGTAIPRLRLSSLEPWDLPAGFFGLWAEPRLLPHLHLPLQSGSDTVLRRMARRCDVASFEQLVADARARIPDLSVTTDLIVGFPGETDAEWEETLATVERIAFADVHAFTYSPREGTAAARMPGHVAGDVQRARHAQLRAVIERHRLAHLERFVGSEREVLWEKRGGYTDNYLRAETTALTRRGSIARVRCVGLSDDRRALRVVPVQRASPLRSGLAVEGGGT